MSEIALEMRSHLIALAGPRQWHDTRESWIARGARRAGLTYRTAKALFYGECTDPKSSVVERVRAAAQQAEANAATELSDLRDQVAVLLDRLATIDPHFSRATIDGLRDTARRLDLPAPHVGADACALDV